MSPDCQSFVTTLASLSLLLLATLELVLPDSSPAAERYWDYVVIGAGPAGLQMGYYLQKAGRQYVIVERNNISGSFFERYPRHGKLISINKRFTGKTNKEFNMRHDWNSLLSDNESLLMKYYSKDFFPNKDSLKDYLNDFANSFKLNIQYNTNVSNIHKVWNDSLDSNIYHMVDQSGNTYQCRYLIVATGMSLPNIPYRDYMHYAEGYEDLDLNPERFEGKSVLILGHGNSAFEVAQSIYGHASVVHMVARSRLRLAWATHYVGDVRSVNNDLLDTYQLKSLDGVLEGSLTGQVVSIERDNETGRLNVDLKARFHKDNFALREPYDHLIRCLGFTFDGFIFNESVTVLRGTGKRAKFPLIDDDFQVSENENMYVAGSAAHSLDFRKAAGGFIHGFRYTVRALHRILEQRNHQVAWPSQQHPVSSLLSVLVKRMNEADALYQMFTILGDVILLSDDGTFRLVPDFPVSLLPEVESVTGHRAGRVLVLVLQYGQNFSGPNHDVFREKRAVGNADEAHRSNFLHPTLYYYPTLPTEEEMAARPEKWPLPRPDRLHHVVEDFLTDWTSPTSHVLPLRRFLQYCSATDLRAFTAEECLGLALSYTSVPVFCDIYLNQGQGIVLHPTLTAEMQAKLEAEKKPSESSKAKLHKLPKYGIKKRWFARSDSWPTGSKNSQGIDQQYFRRFR